VPKRRGATISVVAGQITAGTSEKLMPIMTVDTQRLREVSPSTTKVKGSSSGKRSAKRLLGGAGLGAVIGAVAGNAGMGAAIGATAGAVGSVAQKGKSVNVPSETLLEFRLQQPASLPAR